MCSGEIRSSDRERDDVVSFLCEAYAQGRLDLSDIRDRTAAAYSARTRGDLRRLTEDLPAAPRAGPEPNQRPQRAASYQLREQRQQTDRPVVPVLLTALAWLAMAAADLMPLAAIPLAALPLIIVSMSALFAAGRIYNAQIAAAGTTRQTVGLGTRQNPEMSGRATISVNGVEDCTTSSPAPPTATADGHGRQQDRAPHGDLRGNPAKGHVRGEHHRGQGQERQPGVRRRVARDTLEVQAENEDLQPENQGGATPGNRGPGKRAPPGSPAGPPAGGIQAPCI